ncbi:MAG: hypothetical protein JOZ51_23235 [Chloroflexi bacterium]|nr:hypothetical protein [Chloroflexota bacterium]
MKYLLMWLIALVLLVGCGAPATVGQNDSPAAQTSVAQAAATDAPEPPTATSQPTATVIPSPVAETATPTSTALPTSVPETVVAQLPTPTLTIVPSPVTDPPEPVSTLAAAQGPTPTTQQVGQVSPAEAEQIIAPTTKQAIEALKNRDMVQLASMAHPDKGVLFSPYGFMGEDKVILKAEQLSGALTDPTVRHWGSFDGTGDPIDLTFAAYFERFVYSHDFAAAPQISYNQPIKEIYHAEEFDPSSIMVEYHFPGFDPKYEGLDWQSLRLVFEQQGQTWYLVGILHNQWTI